MPAQLTLTPKVLSSLSRIDQALGRLQGLAISEPQPLLRKRNRVRSVHGTAAIEGNRLTAAQVTAVLDGQRVVGRATDIREILNVNDAYARLSAWQATRTSSLLAAHGVLMGGLLLDAGRFRSGGVGVFRGDVLTHLAPPAHLVRHHVDALLRWGKRTTLPPLLVGCVVHYELLFIHPFSDGNGRLARLWQQVFHRAHSVLLQFVPVESLVRTRQRGYDAALRASDRKVDCTPFVEFSLDALADGVTELATEVRPARETMASRLDRAHRHFGRRWFSRGDYLRLHVRLSTASASRDLAHGVREGTLVTRGARRLTEYRSR